MKLILNSLFIYFLSLFKACNDVDAEFMIAVLTYTMNCSSVIYLRHNNFSKYYHITATLFSTLEKSGGFIGPILRISKTDTFIS